MENSDVYDVFTMTGEFLNFKMNGKFESTLANKDLSYKIHANYSENKIIGGYTFELEMDNIKSSGSAEQFINGKHQGFFMLENSVFKLHVIFKDNVILPGDEVTIKENGLIITGALSRIYEKNHPKEYASTVSQTPMALKPKDFEDLQFIIQRVNLLYNFFQDGLITKKQFEDKRKELVEVM
jgi:hypothetical protein